MGRLYKNGLYGTRYKGYYITGERKDYSIYDEAAEKIAEHIASKGECEWMIEKLTAGDTELEVMRELYSLEIVEISRKITFYFNLSHERELTPIEAKTYALLVKIRSRKAKGEPF